MNFKHTFKKINLRSVFYTSVSALALNQHAVYAATDLADAASDPTNGRLQICNHHTPWGNKYYHY